MTGNSAANVLSGGDGDDSYVIASAADTVVEKADEGTDTVQASISYVLGANVENLILTGAAAINGTGNELDNILTGNSAANVLSGGDGDDIYVIASAADTVVENADEGTDTVRSSITYALGANVENLTLVGGALDGSGNELDNALTGTAAANVLTGGDGDDRIVGGGGLDTLSGGDGADAFAFEALSNRSAAIVDFSQGEDLLEVSAAGFGGGLVAGFAPTVVNAVKTALAFVTGTDGYFIFDTAGTSMGTLYWDATGGSGTDAVAVARLTGVASLTATDFEVV
jgi:Ca2+-binding RTX toxin-like protein